VNVEIDPEQNERPEHDRKERGQDLPPSAQVPEVVVRPGDRDADSDVEEQQDTTAEEHLRFLSAALGRQTGETRASRRGAAPPHRSTTIEEGQTARRPTND
jgi:hypothetical protein